MQTDSIWNALVFYDCNAEVNSHTEIRKFWLISTICLKVVEDISPSLWDQFNKAICGEAVNLLILLPIKKERGFFFFFFSELFDKIILVLFLFWLLLHLFSFPAPLQGH